MAQDIILRGPMVPPELQGRYLTAAMRERPAAVKQLVQAAEIQARVSNLSIGEILGGIGRFFGGGGGGGSPQPFSPPAPSSPCSVIPNEALRRACELAWGARGGGSGSSGGGECTQGRIRVGNQCVSPGDIGPGGAPFTTGAGGQAVAGGFGMAAITPTVETRTVRSCPSGMVLGKDNLCYPRQILSKRSNLRKWKGAQKPPVTVADMKAIRRASRVQGRVKSLAGDVGFTCRKK